jgi:hypothetical protein
MSGTRNFRVIAVLALLTLSLSVSGAVSAAVSNEPTLSEKASPPSSSEVDEAVIWRQQVVCTTFFPAEVQGYRITCNGGSFLDARIADCCIAGDHWQAKLKAWDGNPNSSVATSPGAANLFGTPARVYNYGGTSFNNGISAYLECSYLHGVNVFGASSFIDLSSNGNCTVTADPIRARIDRTP